MTKRKSDDDAPPQRTAVSSPTTKNCFANRPWLLALVLVATTFVAYQPTWHAGFIWDDDLFITQNRMIQARDGLYRSWFTTEGPDYYPLTRTLRWLQWRAWQNNPAGYHLVNVLLHAANAVLLWMVLQRLKIPGAWLAALVFAVHPVNVATVAWVSEQKTTLSMFFSAVTILLYLRFVEQTQWRWYCLSLVAYSLALLSKIAVVTLPAVMLGCVWWLHGKWRWRDFVYCGPFFALSLAWGLVSIHVMGLECTAPVGGPLSRIITAGYVPWFYLYKALLPVNLCMIYPRWRIQPAVLSSYLPALLWVGGFALFWWKRGTWGRPPLFALGCFVVMLFPVLGFFDQRFYEYSLVADHWEYYSLVAVTALAAAGTVALDRRLRRGEQQVIGLFAGVVVMVLAALSWQRCRVFRNEETLFRDNLLHNPLAWAAHYNLGNALLRAGKTEDAIAQYGEALRIRPDYVEAHYNLGNALLQAGKTEDAIAQYREALRIRPNDAQAQNNLGIALYQTGKRDEAIEQFHQALRINPDYAEAHTNLGTALAQTGKIEEAIAHYQQALRIKPDFPEVQNALARLRAGQ